MFKRLDSVVRNVLLGEFFVVMRAEFVNFLLDLLEIWRNGELRRAVRGGKGGVLLVIYKRTSLSVNFGLVIGSSVLNVRTYLVFVLFADFCSEIRKLLKNLVVFGGTFAVSLLIIRNKATVLVEI